MFELETATKAKLIDIVVLSQKNRQPDENPGAKLVVEMSVGNDVLAMFDGYLKSFLFQRASGSGAKQPTLDGVEAASDMPMLSSIGSKVGVLRWAQELTGYQLTVDLGIGGARSNLVVADCKISGWRITPKEGGSCTIKFNVESADVSESAFGKLAKLKSREIEILLAPPEVAQSEIDADAEATPPAVRGRKPKQAAALAH